MGIYYYGYIRIHLYSIQAKNTPSGERKPVETRACIHTTIPSRIGGSGDDRAVVDSRRMATNHRAIILSRGSGRRSTIHYDAPKR